MKYYIPHRILIIHEQVVRSKDDESFLHAMKIAFNWANEMGIKGKRVFGMYLELPDKENYNLLKQHSSLWCQIECTKEERKRWEELQEIQVKNYVYDFLNEKDEE